MPLITLTSATDVVVLYGDDPYASGFTYRNDTLSEWYAFSGADAKSEKRPNGPGAFGFGKLYANAKTLAVKGSFWGGSQTEAAYARRRLTGLFSDGNGITMTVADELGTWTRRLHLVEADVPFLPYPNFEFTLNLEASDPKRYGPTQLVPIGVPSSSSGLIWPLGTSSSGVLYSWSGAAYASTSLLASSGSNRTNYSTNPSPEGNTTTGLAPNQYGPVGSITVSTDRARLSTRTRSWKYTAVGGGNGEGVQFALPSGQRYASIWVYNPSPNGVDHLGITAIVPSGQTGVTRVAAKNAWTLLSIDTGTTAGGTVVVYNDETSTAAGTVFYFTDILIGDQGEYFDGAFQSTTLFFDWGTAGTDGRGTFTNAGNASTVPSFTLDGGSIANGFRITEIETGRELTYSADVIAGTPVFLNGVTQGVQLAGSGEYRTRLTRRGWPTIPPSSTRTYQFTPLGAVTGNPVLTMSVAIADL